MKTVPLSGKHAAGRVALVDDEDYDLVSQYKWLAHVDGDRVYARATSKGHVPMHKLITGQPATDHRNGDGLDNQRKNLRPATKAQNNHNQRPRRGTSSRFKGVTWHKQRGKWQAEIKVNGKSRYLGLYASEEEAAAVYAAAALQVQGEYAYAAREAPGA
jgi:AP2 domain